MNSGECREAPSGFADLTKADEAYLLNQFLDSGNSSELEEAQAGTSASNNQVQYAQPRATPGTTQRSEFRGVSYDRKKRKWRVQIKVSTLAHSGFSVGYYHSELDAARAYDRAAIGLLGPDQAERVINFALANYDVDSIPRIEGRSREDVKAVLKQTRQLTSCQGGSDKAGNKARRSASVVNDDNRNFANTASRARPRQAGRAPRRATQLVRNHSAPVDASGVDVHTTDSALSSTGGPWQVSWAMEGQGHMPSYGIEHTYGQSLSGVAHRDGSQQGRRGSLPQPYGGICQDGNGHWEAKVMYNNRVAYCQTFDSENDAAMAYQHVVRQLVAGGPHASSGYGDVDAQAVGGPAGDAWQVLSDGAPSGLFDLSGSGNEDVHSGSSGAVCHPGRREQTSPEHPAQQYARGPGRGMTKSSSVSTLFAATTLYDAAVEAGSGLPPIHRSSLPDTPEHNASYDAMSGGQNLSAASLLMAASGGPAASGGGGHENSDGGTLSGTGTDSGAVVSISADGGVGRSKRAPSAGARAGMRKSSSIQDLGVTGSVTKGGAAGVQKATRTSARAAAHRRPGATSAVGRSRGAPDAMRGMKDDGSGSGALAGGGGSGGAGAGVSSGGGDDGRAEDSQEERMRVYRALMMQQERLHEQMRAHQAQHEEQQRRAAQKQSEQRSGPGGSGSLAPAAAAAQRSGGFSHAAPSAATAPPQGMSGTGMTPRGQRQRGATPGAGQSGGKMPRVSSEPQALASLGVAGMGGRHHPTQARRAEGGIRKVQSTNNFAAMSSSLRMPRSKPATMRASPSLPAFPSHEPVFSGVDEVPESPRRAMTPLSQLLMDDNADFMSLIQDLADGGGRDLEFADAAPIRNVFDESAPARQEQTVYQHSSAPALDAGASLERDGRWAPQARQATRPPGDQVEFASNPQRPDQSSADAAQVANVRTSGGARLSDGYRAGARAKEGNGGESTDAQETLLLDASEADLGTEFLGFEGDLALPGLDDMFGDGGFMDP